MHDINRKPLDIALTRATAIMLRGLRQSYVRVCSPVPQPRTHDTMRELRRGKAVSGCVIVQRQRPMNSPAKSTFVRHARVAAPLL